MKSKPIGGETLHPTAPRAEDFSTSVESTDAGGHRWTIRWAGRTILTSTSGSSVSAIHFIGDEFDPALKRLAKK
jgi:hypothetical protein